MSTSEHVCGALLFAMPDAGKAQLLAFSFSFSHMSIGPHCQERFSCFLSKLGTGCSLVSPGQVCSLGSRTLGQGAGRLSRGHSLARLPSRGCL